jgi:hypothetical protein
MISRSSVEMMREAGGENVSRSSLTASSELTSPLCHLLLPGHEEARSAFLENEGMREDTDREL